jgi:hypothetical protein
VTVTGPGRVAARLLARLAPFLAPFLGRCGDVVEVAARLVARQAGPRRVTVA